MGKTLQISKFAEQRRLRTAPTSAGDGEGVGSHMEQDRKNSPRKEKRSPKSARGGTFCSWGGKKKIIGEKSKKRDGHVSTKCGLRVKKKEKKKKKGKKSKACGLSEF